MTPVVAANNIHSLRLPSQSRVCNPSSRKSSWGFPGGAVVKNPTANAGGMGSSPGLGRSHMPRSN